MTPLVRGCTKTYCLPYPILHLTPCKPLTAWLLHVRRSSQVRACGGSGRPPSCGLAQGRAIRNPDVPCHQAACVCELQTNIQHWSVVLTASVQEYTHKYEHVVAVVDPPRAGLHKDVLFAILTCPAIKRLVYVSCNQDSLVQNAKILCGRYRPDLNAPKGTWQSR